MYGGSLGGVRQQFSTPTEIEFAIRGRNFWQSFKQRFDYPCKYYDDGYVMVTGREKAYEKLCDAANLQRSCGAPDVEMRKADDLLKWIDALTMVMPAGNARQVVDDLGDLDANLPDVLDPAFNSRTRKSTGSS